MTAGMIQDVPRTAVPIGSGRVIENGRVRDDWVGIREGTGEVGTKPDSNRVIKVFSFVGEDLVRRICRVTQSTFHVWDGSSWTAFTVVGGFKGTAKRVTVSQLFGKVYLAFGISDGLWEVDFDLSTVTRVSEAPGGKFTISFAERVWVANLNKTVGGIFPSTIAGSANSDPQDWTGESAVEENLIADSLGNEITGFAALESHAVIVRRTSIHLMSRQPFALAPVRIDRVVNGIGSDLPYTTVVVPGGIIFADSRTQDVYFWRPGTLPESLAHRDDSHIHHLLYEDLAAATFAEATYDPSEGEYHLGLTWETDDDLITRRWICNVHRGKPAWSYDDSPALTTLGVVLPPAVTTTIDDLSGTINALSGSIDSLSSRSVPSSALYAGVATGEVIEFSYSHPLDWDSTEFEFTFQSPNLGSPSRRRTMKDLEVTCSIPVTGDVTIEQSKDESAWSNSKTASRTGASTRQKVRLPKTQITGDDLYWRIKTNASGFKIRSWWARMMEKGLQAGGQQ